MKRLASVAIAGFMLSAGLVTAGCQAHDQAPPAQAPIGMGPMVPVGSPGQPPPPPPQAGQPGAMGPMMHDEGHADCPGGACPHHEMGPGGEPPCEACDMKSMHGMGMHPGRAHGPDPGGGMMMGGFGGGMTGPGQGHDVMRQLGELGVRVYPPRVILRRAQDVGLTPDQASKIRQEVLSTQVRSVDLLAKIEHAKLEVARALAAEKVDEKAADAQIDEAARAGAELHKLHLGSLLRVRALLTPEQRQKLDERKPGAGGPKAGPGGPGPTTDASDAMDDDDDGDDD